MTAVRVKKSNRPLGFAFRAKMHRRWLLGRAIERVQRERFEAYKWVLNK